jgi:hypothetical protein
VSDRVYDIAIVGAGPGGLWVSRAERVRRPVMTEEGERNAIDALVRVQRPARHGRGDGVNEDLTVTLELQDGYRFLVDFGDERLPPLLMAEPPPLGEGNGTTSLAPVAAVSGRRSPG